MPAIVWDKPGERIYETGTDRGVLYVQNAGVYGIGVPWNGLTGVKKSPSGGEAKPVYADNIKYLNLVSAEELGGTIEALTYPKQFGACDGTVELIPGVTAGQQNRSSFGFSWRTLIGNDTVGQGFGYKIHIVYGAVAKPTSKDYKTVNDTPEPIPFSWEFSTSAVPVLGAKPTASLELDTTTLKPGQVKAVEDLLYGNATLTAKLPSPDEIITALKTITT